MTTFTITNGTIGPVGLPFRHDNFPAGSFFKYDDSLYQVLSWTKKADAATVACYHSGSLYEVDDFDREDSPEYFPIAKIHITYIV